MIWLKTEILQTKGGDYLERFACPTTIVTGDAGQALAQRKSKGLLLVADPYFVEDGTVQHLLQAAGAERTAVFSQIQPDPSVELAAKGTALVKEFQPDTVVALGGGSAMDCAKAMVYFAGRDVELVAIPTTSGSGSEVTDFAILTHSGVKHPLVDDRLRPRLAILDGSLLEKQPKRLIADTGFDVLTHALEAWVATGGGGITDALAKEAFCVTFAHLPASYGGNIQVRLRIHTASCMAGMAFSGAGLGLCHAMSHALGGMFHVSHGRLNAILIPAVIGLNAQVAGEKYARLARCAGLQGAADSVAVRNLKNGLIRLRRELGMPHTLQEAGIDPRQIRRRAGELVAAILEDPCCKTNPVPVEDYMVRKVLEEVTGHV